MLVLPILQSAAVVAAAHAFPLFAVHELPFPLFAVTCAQPVDPKADPQAIEARHLLARKQQLLDPEHGTLKK
jgi:hypothetical protein